MAETDKSFSEQMSDLGTSAGGIFKNILPALLRMPVSVLDTAIQHPERLLAAGADMMAPMPVRGPAPNTYRNIQFLKDQRQKQHDELVAFAVSQGLSEDKARLLPMDVTTEDVWTMAHPKPAPLTHVKGGEWVQDPGSPGGWRQVGTPEPKPVTNEIAILEASGLSPTDALAKANQGKMDRAIAGAGGRTTATINAKRAATTLGDTKDYWISKTDDVPGYPRGAKLPADMPMSVAQGVGTKLTVTEQKKYDAVEDMTIWLKELGANPDGTMTEDGQRRLKELFSRKQGLLPVLGAGAKRNWKYYTGDPDAQTLDQVMSILKTEFARSSAGTLRVNAQELQLIKAAHPGPRDTASTAAAKLARLAKYVQIVRDRMIGGIPPPPDNAVPFSTTRVPGLLLPGGPVSLSPEEAGAFSP